MRKRKKSLRKNNFFFTKKSKKKNGGKSENERKKRIGLVDHQLPWRPGTAKGKFFKLEKFLYIKNEGESHSNDTLPFDQTKSTTMRARSMMALKKKKKHSSCAEVNKTYDWFKFDKGKSLNRKVLLVNDPNPRRPKLVRRPRSAAPNFLRPKIDRIKKGMFGAKKQVLIKGKGGFFDYIENNEFDTIRKKKWYYMKNLRGSVDEKEESKKMAIKDKAKKERITRSVLADKAQWWKWKQFELQGRKGEGK